MTHIPDRFFRVISGGAAILEWYVYKGYLNLVTSISYIGKDKYLLEDVERKLRCEKVPLERLNSWRMERRPLFSIAPPALGRTFVARGLRAEKVRRMACPCTHPQNKHDYRVYK